MRILQKLSLSNSTAVAPPRADVRNGVLIGSDGWLYLHDGTHRQFDYLTGRLKVSRKSVDHFVANLRRRQAFCAKRGMRYLHLVSPSKLLVFTDALPDDYKSGLTSLYETYYQDRVSAAGLDCVLYPRHALIQANADAPMFLPHDSHMSDIGNLTVTDEVLDVLGMPDIPQSYLTSRPCLREGDLGVMLGDTSGFGTIAFDPNIPMLRLSNRRDISRNTGHLRILRSPNSLTPLRLLIFGDSFLNGTLKYFACAFREVIFLRSSTFCSQIAEALAPDVILTGNTERYLRDVHLDTAAEPSLDQIRRDSPQSLDPEFSEAVQAQLGAFRASKGFVSWQNRSDSRARRTLSVEMTPVQNLDFASEREDSITWTSRSKDPVGIVSGLSGRRHLSVTMFLRMPRRTVFQAFVTLATPGAIPARCAHSSDLRKGWNRVHFQVDANFDDCVLRIDPMTHPGVFVLENMTVRDVTRTLGLQPITQAEPPPTQATHRH